MTHRFRLLPLALIVIVIPAAAAARQARDAAPATPRPSGTAAITGLLVTDDAAAAPVRRAIVTLAGDVIGGAGRSVISNDAGAFAVNGLPAGRYTITATKAAHLPASLGATRPGRPGTSIALAEGATMAVTLRMARAAVITGVVRDGAGKPVPDVQVVALAPLDPRSVGSMIGPTGQSTDDRGEYRLYGVKPGEYVVVAIASTTRTDGLLRARSDAEVDAVLAELKRRGGGTQGPVGGAPGREAPRPAPAGAAVGFAPLYYPGTTVFAAAERLAIDAGDMRTSVDFSLTPVPMVSIDGAVVSGDGQAVANVQMSLSFDGPQFSTFQGPRPILSEPPGADGRFRYTNMAPGRYRIMARSTGGAAPGSGSGRGGGVGGAVSFSAPGMPGGPDLVGARYGVAMVDVTGQDVTGVSLALHPGVTLSGRVSFDAAAVAPPADLTRIRVTLSPQGGSGMSSSGGTVIGNPFNSVRPVMLSPDGTFAMTGIAPGTYLIGAALPTDVAAAWWFRSALLGGRDLLDAALVVAGPEPLEPVRLTFSDRRSSLAGTLQSVPGAPPPDVFVVVFPSDRAQWVPGSRRVRSARPGTDGTFIIADLPAGDYLLAAITDVEPRDLARRSFLDPLAAAAIPVTIREGERTVQDVRIGGE